LTEYALNGYYDQLGTSTIVKIYEESYSSTDYVILIFEVNNLNLNTGLQDFDLKYYYQNSGLEDSFDFNRSESCIWTGGNFNGGEFNFSKWTGGDFNEGVFFGGIWQNGTFNFGTMSNSYWENGTWRNGTWDGSPFNYSSLDIDGNYLSVTNNKNKFAILNISDYTDNYKIHLNNIFTKERTSIETSVHNFSPQDGFLSWTFSKNE
jgi:hypothetical protein